MKTTGDLREIVITAAHGGVSTGSVPVGGGAAVIHQLLRHWAPAGVPVRVLGLGERLDTDGVAYEQVPVSWPRGCGPADIVRLNELDYGRISSEFEQAVTRRILAGRREGVCVLANDISEGPDFAALAAASVPVVTLWHVDVVDYFCRFYLRGLPPERVMAAFRRLGPAARSLPAVLRLVFEKQTACVWDSVRHVVPSSPMRDVIARCFPGAADKVEVVPWGAWATTAPEAQVAAEVAALRETYQLRQGERVIVTLSRLSPEKGIERLLRALRLGEQRGEMPDGVRVLIAGEAAFMMGARYRAMLVRLARPLRHCRVDFVGYASGVRKQALWRLADLYVFPSRHESYGLTLAEALAAGVPVVSTAHYSARDLVPPAAGLVVPNGPEAQVPAALWHAVGGLLAAPDRLAAYRRGAERSAPKLDFAPAAARVLDICRASCRVRPSA